VLGALAAMASFYCDLRAIAPVRNALSSKVREVLDGF